MLVTFQFKDKPQKVKKPSKSVMKTQKIEEHLMMENPDSNAMKKRSRNGCVTCKIRKKRCDESKPICGDCARLNRPCKYLNDTMTPEETKRIKSEILVMEEEYKCRRRNKKRPKSSSSKQNKVVFNPLTPLSSEMPLSEEFTGATLTSAPQHTAQVAHNTDHAVSPNSFHNKSHSIHDLFSQFSNQFPFSPFMMKSPNIENGEAANLLHDLPELHLDSEFLPTYQQEFEAEMSKDVDFSNEEQNNNAHSNNFNSKNGSHYRPQYESSRVELLDEDKNNFTNHTQPHNHHLEIIDNPSLIATTTLSVLNSQDMMYYDYFKRRLSRIISIVPEKENLYLKIFLPMAHYDLGCLYGILAWSSFHMGNHHHARGNIYVDKALKYISDTTVNEDTTESDNTATKWLSKHNRVNMRLASLLIICGAEICKGDVKNWGSYLEQAAMLVKSNGGLSNFNESQSQHWLIANLAYHDILTSSASEKGLLFSLDEYARVINFSKFGLDPLHGISKPLFQIIAEISSLATEVKHLLKRTTSTLTNQYLGHNPNSLDSPEFDYATDIPGTSSTSGSTSDESVTTEFETRHEALSYINSRANDILSRIDGCQPSMEFLRTLPPKDLNLQLSLFQVFQLAAKLHMQQSVLKNPATSLPIQLLVCEMSQYLDHVLNSPVESCLCFPLFICGMNCCTKKDRKLIRDKFDEYLDRYRYGNVERTKIIMEQVWMMNPTGSKNIDWYEIVKKLGWNLSFA